MAEKGDGVLASGEEEHRIVTIVTPEYALGGVMNRNLIQDKYLYNRNHIVSSMMSFRQACTGFK